ncbi:sensor histidine kinase [Pectinatus haikarae]|uniref:histidine kinase n=1 Tax=Pectinatus haikarae TaxID=349096 RepID=A0ABT9Y3I4_9FIRM|nr:HAMP domain-containing sensor histidine kinase [Pectinatus haikarae]MDQ0202390.1 signal transduction histidine kinase [Pectinatus haikarae]
MDIIKNLRRKFIAAATAAVVIIVAGALGLINTIVYMRMHVQVESVLLYISQNGGNVPQEKTPQDSSWFGDTNWSDDTPEFSYQTRFFSVLVNPAGYIEKINIKNIAAFTEDEAIQYAQSTAQEGKMQGFFKKDRASYAYMITKDPSGNFLIVIMDYTRDAGAVDSFMHYSLLFGFICILLYIFILAALCNMAIKPFILNMENQKRFITNAGHELKTPIAIISANTEAMELINGKSEWTVNILKQVHRLSKLINDLIMLAKMGERSRADLDITSVDLSETVTTVTESFRQMLSDQKKGFTCRIDPLIHIQSDAKCIYELINILVDNAVKYCDDNGTVNVILSRNKKNTGAIIAISNTHIAGAAIDYSRFFERFYRGDVSHNSKRKGYGIGLAMAKELAQLIKGKLNVSYTNEIITFTVRLNT